MLYTCFFQPHILVSALLFIFCFQTTSSPIHGFAVTFVKYLNLLVTEQGRMRFLPL